MSRLVQRPRRLQLAVLWLSACGVDAQSTTATPTPQVPQCSTYCSLVLARCTAHWPLYDSPQACADACATLPAPGAIGEVFGDTLGCRMTYLMLADIAPARFCPHAAADGSKMCRATQ